LTQKPTQIIKYLQKEGWLEGECMDSDHLQLFIRAINTFKQRAKNRLRFALPSKA